MSAGRPDYTGKVTTYLPEILPNRGIAYNWAGSNIADSDSHLFPMAYDGATYYFYLTALDIRTVEPGLFAMEIRIDGVIKIYTKFTDIMHMESIGELGISNKDGGDFKITVWNYCGYASWVYLNYSYYKIPK